MPSHFSEKVRLLCKEVAEVEWSGVLFYRTLGEFGKPGFKCLLEDILLMDIGDKTKTKYGAAGINCFLEEKPVLRSARKGHIHSHNTMPVFFSDDDERELSKNTQCHCYYLSVIVNNAGEMIGRLCYMADSVRKQSEVLTVQLSPGREQQITMVDRTSNRRLLCYHDCQFLYHSSTIDEPFKSRIKEIAAQNGYKPKKRSAPPRSAAVLPTEKTIELSQLGIFDDKTLVSGSVGRKVTAKSTSRKKTKSKTTAPGAGLKNTKKRKA